jgi:hypothetical protein
VQKFILIGTEPENIESVLEPCGHLGLFVGSDPDRDDAAL